LLVVMTLWTSGKFCRNICRRAWSLSHISRDVLINCICAQN